MTLQNLNEYIRNLEPKIQKALFHLEYSKNKVKKILPTYQENDLEALETLESFTSRFARLSDLYTKQYLRTLVLKGDPSFKGSLYDFLNQSEKLNYISNANRWWGIRALRNKEAHEYTADHLKLFVKIILDESDFMVKEIRSHLSF